MSQRSGAGEVLLSETAEGSSAGSNKELALYPNHHCSGALWMGLGLTKEAQAGQTTSEQKMLFYDDDAVFGLVLKDANQKNPHGVNPLKPKWQG